MKNIIICILLFISITEAQKIKYGNFSPQLKAVLKDTTSSIIADTADVLRSDIGDSLGLKSVLDTTTLKMISYTDSTKIIFVKEICTNGVSGFFKRIDSTFTEGVIAFDCPVAGDQYVLIEFYNNRIMNPMWAGAYADSTNSAANNVAFQKAVVHAYYTKAKTVVPTGKFLLDSITYLPPHTDISGDPINTWLIIKDDGDNSINLPHFQNWNSKAGDIGYSSWDSLNANYRIANMILVGPASAALYEGSTVPATNPYNGLADGVAGDDGGIFMQPNIAGGYDDPMEATVENITGIRIGMGIQLKGMEKVEIRNCDVSNINWAAYTPVAQNYILENCLSDSTQFGVESLCRPYPLTGHTTKDSTAFGKIINCTFKNFYWYGASVYSYTNFLFQGNQLFGTQNWSGSNFEHGGLWIKVSRQYMDDVSSTKRSIIISDNTINKTRGGGIYFSVSGTGLDSTLGNVTIHDNIIQENYKTGISFSKQLNTNFDTTSQIGRVLIHDNNLWNNGRTEEYNGTQQIYLNYCDSAYVHHNVVYRDTSKLGHLTAAPVFIKNSIGVIIEANDFRSQYPTIFVLADSFSVATAKLINNFGLDVDGALYDNDNNEGYPQNIWVDETTGQAAIGGYPNTVFFIPQIINNDSLCIVKYNTSGAIVDTSDRINN